MQGDAGEQLRVRGGGLDRPARALDVVADLDRPGHADRGGCREGLVQAALLGGLVAGRGRDVQVAVVVDDG